MCLFDDFAQLVGRGVALDREAHANPFEAVAHLGVQPEDAVEVDVTFDCGGHFDEFDAAIRSDVHEAGGERARECVH